MSIRRSTCGRTASRDAADRRRPTSGASSPMTIAQPNSATVGAPIGGRPGIASENVPSPVSESSPRKISEPMPAASSPGRSTIAEHRPAEAGGLEQQERAEQRRAQQRRDGREACPRRRRRRARGRRRSRGSRAARRARRARCRARSAAPPGRARRRRSSVASAASTTPGSWLTGNAPPVLKPVGRRVAARPREVADRGAGEEPGNREQRHRPPDGADGRSRASTAAR